MRTTLRPLAALAVVAVLGAGCSNGSGEDGDAATGAAAPAPRGSGAGPSSTDREQAVRFAACMRTNGIREFPDPDASGELTIDGIVNGSSLDTSAPAWQDAIAACRDLQPPGFTGRRRSAAQQEHALAFAQCMRDNGVEDFPDPTGDAPLVDTNRIPSAAGRGARSIPGFQAAMQQCSSRHADELGLDDR